MEKQEVSTLDKINRDIFEQTCDKHLNEKEVEYLRKFALFLDEGLSLVRYAAAMRYMQPILLILLESNRENATNNPFFQILMTLEDTSYKSFILSFANFFLLINPKKDTFTIKSLHNELASKKNNNIFYSEEYDNLLVKSELSKKYLKYVFDFFENKRNKQNITTVVDMRNHIIAHMTIKNFEYDSLPEKLNDEIEFFIRVTENLHKIIGIKQLFNIRDYYKDEMMRWAFLYNNIKGYSDFLMSDKLTEKIVEAFNLGKSKTKW